MSAVDLEKIDVDTALAHTKETVERSGTSFAAGMAILPKPRREAMHAIYAFCREVDDIADDDGISRSARLAGLKNWRDEIDRVFDGNAATPTGVALERAIAGYRLSKNEFIKMIEGMEMDANGPVVAPSWDALFTYTRCVAGSVGMLSMPAFGAPEGEAPDNFALALGDALQLTNILRDVREDAEIGRLYLPKELLEKHGVPLDPSRVFETSAVSKVAAEVGVIAGQKFSEARIALSTFDWRTVRPALLMMGVYEAYHSKMVARGWDKVGEPLKISKLEKVLISARYAVAPPLKAAQ